MSRSRLGEVLRALPDLVSANLKRKYTFRVLPWLTGPKGTWAVQSRAMGDAPWHKVVVRHGTTDWSVFRAVFADEAYRLERTVRCNEIRRRYQEIVDTGKAPLIVDAGANVGYASLWYGGAFPKALVVGIEPHAGNIESARKNCVLPNVRFVHAGIASAPGVLTIIDPGRGDDAFRTTRAGAGEAGVTALSMQEVIDLAAECGPVEPLIAKIDIEGFESELFAGNVDWVDRFQLIVIELHDWMLPGQASSAKVLACLAARGRDFTWFGENAWSVRNPRTT